MIKKICPYCNGNSYSSYEGISWICPYCKNNISGLNSCKSKVNRVGNLTVINTLKNKEEEMIKK